MKRIIIGHIQTALNIQTHYRFLITYLGGAVAERSEALAQFEIINKN